MHCLVCGWILKFVSFGLIDCRTCCITLVNIIHHSNYLHTGLQITSRKGCY